MVRHLFCRKRGRHSSRNVSNWILSTLCTFMCYFGMMDMSDNCNLLKSFVNCLVILINMGSNYVALPSYRELEPIEISR